VRLLGVTNFYPPLGYGYGAICRDVMNELQARGHRSTILCADGGVDGPLEVRRGLGHVPAAWRRPRAGLRAEVASQRLVRAAIAEGVDAALIWHMRGIGKGSLALLHHAGIPVIYLLGDLWVVYERPGPPATWHAWSSLEHLAAYRAARDAAGRMVGAGRIELAAPPIEREGIVCFASTWLAGRYAKAGFRPRNGQVVPNGIRIEEFAGSRDDPPAGELRVLFAGRLDPAKGADLAVSAIANVEGARLVLAGGGDPASVQAIRRQIAGLGLEGRIDMIGEVTRSEIAELMRRNDVLVMPGRYPDAFGLVYVEAMAAGAVVVGTAKGGAAEICRDGENGLVVTDQGPGELSAALRRLRDDPGLRERLRAGGAATARHYGLGTMVDRIELLLS
jgi:glycosyltransferase involved in cell wall biosynthesis